MEALNHLTYHPTIKEFKLLFPISHEDILRTFRQCIQDSKSPTGTTFVLFDTVVSNPGVLMPWKEMVQICKSLGALSLVDAAHSIGHETNINLSEVSPDFWVTVRPAGSG